MLLSGVHTYVELMYTLPLSVYHGTCMLMSFSARNMNIIFTFDMFLAAISSKYLESR